MSYFEHYKHINDLSDSGRKKYWKCYDSLYKKFLPENKNARILDFGCGAGLLMEWMQKECSYTNVTGIDIDMGQIDFARRLGLDANWSDDPVSWLKTKGVSYDLIIMKDVLEHIPDTRRVDTLKELHSLLSLNGVLLLTTPNANSDFAARMLYNDLTHHTAYTENSLRYLLGLAGYNTTLIHFFTDDVWHASSILGFLKLVLKLIVRGIRRLSAIAEFGAQGVHIPLSLNLMVVYYKRGSDEGSSDH